MSVATPSTQCQDRLTGPEIKEGLESGEFPTGQIVCGPVQSARSTEPYDTPDDDRNRPSNTDKPTYHISDVISSALNTRTPRRTDREPGDLGNPFGLLHLSTANAHHLPPGSVAGPSNIPKYQLLVQDTRKSSSALSAPPTAWTVFEPSHPAKRPSESISYSVYERDAGDVFRPAKKRRADDTQIEMPEIQSDIHAPTLVQSQPNKAKKAPKAAKTAGTMKFQIPPKCLDKDFRSDPKMQEWTEARSRFIISQGKTVGKIYVNGDNLCIDWRVENEHLEPSQPSNSWEGGCLQGDPMPARVPPDYDIGPNRARIPLPDHTHPGQPQYRSARSTWIIGHLSQRAKEDTRLYRKHYIVNDGKLLIVEFWPPQEDNAKDHSELKEDPGASPQSAIGVAALSHFLASESTAVPSLPQTSAGSPAPTVDAPSLLTTSASHLGIPPPNLQPGPTEGETDPTMRQGSPPGIRCPVLLLGPIAKLTTDRTKATPLGPDVPQAVPEIHPFPQSHKTTACLDPTSPSCSPTLSMQLLPYLPHPNSYPRNSPTAAAPNEGHDIEGNIRLVQPMTHQQIILPTPVQRQEGPASPRCVIPQLIVSDRYVISWIPGNHPDFIPRLPPRAPLTMRGALPENIGTVCGAALTQAPSRNQAIFVSKGNGAQASILNFDSEKFDPKIYTFEQRPHRPGASLYVATLPSVAESDSGIQFVSGDSLGELFRWSFDGSAISVDAMRLVDLSSMSSYQNQHSFTALMWAPGIRKLWAGMTASENASGNPAYIITQWDISKGSGELTGSRKVYAPILNVHQVSENVILAEVDDPSLQFVLHDWRVPRAIHQFGYDHSRWVGTHMRGDIKNHLFARGDGDGTVRLWDVRNIEDHQVLTLSPGDHITQIAFDTFADGSDRLVSHLSQNELIFSSLQRV